MWEDNSDGLHSRGLSFDKINSAEMGEKHATAAAS